MRKITLFLMLAAAVAFADKKITDLPLQSAGLVNLQDSFPFWNSSNGTTMRLRLSDLLSVPLLRNQLTLTNLAQSGASTSQIPQWNGSQWVPVTLSGVGIQSINGDPTSIQLISGSTPVSISTSGGTTTISLTTVPVAKGGTNSTASLNNNRIMQSSGGAIVEASSITASRALQSDANGIPSAATTTAAELGYLSGVTSAVQSQLNAKLATSGVGLVDMLSGHLESPTDKTYVLVQKAPFAFTINTLDIQTVSGTASADVKINGTNVTGISAVSVSSVAATGTASAANSVSAGDKVTFVLSSSSSPADLTFTLKYTR